MDYLILALAVWRISSLFVDEDGPLNVFGHVRNLDPIGLLGCLWCFSVWVGVGAALFYWYTPFVAVFVALPFALSAAAIFFNLLIEKLS